MQNESLTSKVVLITGAARRIGAQIARTLHRAGMNIALHYNTSFEEATNLSNELNKIRPDSVRLFCANLEVVEEITNLVAHVVKAWNRLDVLVNNASQFYRTPLGQVTEKVWEQLFANNLKAPFFLAQSAAPHLCTHQGLIVNLTDIHTERPLRDYPVYCMTKSGLVMMTKALAKELSPNIRVNAIAPGSIMWPEGENSLGDEEKQKIINQTALLRHGSAQNIADAVLFFVRDGDFITGQVLNVDGGRL